MKILRLNEISPVADSVFKGYEYSANVQKPDGIILRSYNMHEFPLDGVLGIARAGAGVNNVPVEKCTQEGIVVFNSPGANANAVKELVLCELFLGARKIVDGASWAQSLKGKEDISKLVEKGKSSFAGGEILGKRLGVVGLGAIGAMVANAAIELGMSVVGYDPFLSVKNAWMLNNRVELTETLDTIFSTCDFITLHVPLNGDTKGMIGKKTLAQCKDGVVIVNNARGELVVSADMIEAVESKKVARYITDFPDDSLLGRENILCVPHLGASTAEAEDNCAYMAAKELVDYLENGNITNSVNYPAVSMPRGSVARLCIHHKNIKEILSKILAIIASQGINVAHMQDQSRGEYAYLILDLDSKPSEASVELLRGVQGVIRVREIG